MLMSLCVGADKVLRRPICNRDARDFTPRVTLARVDCGQCGGLVLFFFREGGWDVGSGRGCCSQNRAPNNCQHQTNRRFLSSTWKEQWSWHVYNQWPKCTVLTVYSWERKWKILFNLKTFNSGSNVTKYIRKILRGFFPHKPHNFGERKAQFIKSSDLLIGREFGWLSKPCRVHQKEASIRHRDRDESNGS